MRLLILPLLLSFVASASADQVRVGKFPAKIVPEQVVPLNFSGKGVVTDFTDASGRLQAGTVVAILNKELTETEREDMELGLERDMLTKRDEMRKLEAQRHKVEFFLSLTPEEQRFSQEAASADGAFTREALQDIDARLDLLRREAATMERRKRHDFEAKHNELTLRMPFDGRLQYNITLPEDLGKPYQYTGGAYNGFAVACDDSAFYITIAISNSALTQLPEQSFSVTVPLPDRKELRGTFSHRKVERSNNGGDLLVYYFRVPEEANGTAYSMLGSNASAVLYFDAGEDVESVSKASLVADPRAAQCDDWEQLIEIVRPGYGIVIITDRTIIIRKH